jgi:hypothetical protein
MQWTTTKTVKYEARTDSLDAAVAFVREHEGEMAVTDVSIQSEWVDTRTFGQRSADRAITGYRVEIEGTVPVPIVAE